MVKVVDVIALVSLFIKSMPIVKPILYEVDIIYFTASYR